ncbi:hypothetical protein BpHYR1_035225 [Brachionus plicatilis]|uniref:Uncharacterized protein n=1 Tax=Brachionus plicatilis TaxID=10195 RepID=A0A3M7TAI2_BRAPC|nr:hypothetical protein BpHYR1_035225 [Brachionus plicatilis]
MKIFKYSVIRLVPLLMNQRLAQFDIDFTKLIYARILLSLDSMLKIKLKKDDQNYQKSNKLLIFDNSLFFSFKFDSGIVNVLTNNIKIILKISLSDGSKFLFIWLRLIIFLIDVADSCSPPCIKSSTNLHIRLNESNKTNKF